MTRTDATTLATASACEARPGAQGLEAGRRCTREPDGDRAALEPGIPAGQAPCDHYPIFAAAAALAATWLLEPALACGLVLTALVAVQKLRTGRAAPKPSGEDAASAGTSALRV